jgi:transcriptional regulator with XRE-family HTH domain
MIGEKIVHRREELGLTQVQLSKMCGIKAPTLNNYEKNKTFPNEENLFRLMKALKCDANYLFGSTITAESFTLTEWERISVKKFRTLDKYGKNTIATMIDLEYKRCKKMRHVRKPEIIQIKMSPFAVSAGTGVGLVVLYKRNKNIKENVLITIGLYLIGIIFALLLSLFNI